MTGEDCNETLLGLCRCNRLLELAARHTAVNQHITIPDGIDTNGYCRNVGIGSIRKLVAR